jgi:hypothetical protein
MFISKEIQAIAQGPFTATRNGKRFAQMRAYLDAFVEGRRISVASDPHKKPKTSFMARNEPVRAEVFDIRCLDPAPGIRVFGRFSEFNTFVALTWEHREAINGKDFDAAVNRCIAAWQTLFPLQPLFSGRNLNDYLSDFIAV